MADGAPLKCPTALIIDTSYTNGEYQQKKGWGYGTYGASLNLAEQASARKLFLTHH